jgi:hypothetical protein
MTIRFDLSRLSAKTIRNLVKNSEDLHRFKNSLTSMVADLRSRRRLRLKGFAIAPKVPLAVG